MLLNYLKLIPLAISDWLLALAGIIIMPILLLFRIEYPDTEVPYTQYKGNWKLVRLPSWALWWDNPADGMCGDTRGWWNNYCLENYNKDAYAFYSMFQWAAIRNSANYYGRIILGIDESCCVVNIVKQWRYGQYLEAIHENGKKYWLFEGFIPYGNNTHGLEWRLGWKIDLDKPTKDLPEQERYRGIVMRVRPWKAV